MSEADYLPDDRCAPARPNFCQAAIPHLLATEGNVVNIASNAGLMGQAYTVAYCMTKGASSSSPRPWPWSS